MIQLSCWLFSSNSTPLMCFISHVVIILIYRLKFITASCEQIVVYREDEASRYNILHHIARALKHDTRRNKEVIVSINLDEQFFFFNPLPSRLAEACHVCFVYQQDPSRALHAAVMHVVLQTSPTNLSWSELIMICPPVPPIQMCVSRRSQLARLSSVFKRHCHWRKKERSLLTCRGPPWIRTIAWCRWLAFSTSLWRSLRSPEPWRKPGRAQIRVCYSNCLWPCSRDPRRKPCFPTLRFTRTPVDH